MKTITESIRDYIMNYPELKEGCLLVDFLGDKAVEYTIEPVPCDPVVQKYVDGGCIKQFLFIFASREYYSEDVNLCLDNLGFYEQFEEWIKNLNDEGVLPELDGERVPVSIEVLTKGYAFSAEADTARYQIQLRLLYEEE